MARTPGEREHPTGESQSSYRGAHASPRELARHLRRSRRGQGVRGEDELSKTSRGGMDRPARPRHHEGRIERRFRNFDSFVLLLVSGQHTSRPDAAWLSPMIGREFGF